MIQINFTTQIGSLYIGDSAEQMKSSKKNDSKQNGIAPEPELRRSGRERKEPKNDQFLMGSSYLEEVLGCSNYQDEAYPKRRRKNYRFDDSQDYEDGPRSAKKKQINTNKTEALLEWKDLLYELPYTLNYIPEEKNNLAEIPLHKIKASKNLSHENLAAITEDIEALFINIDWGKKNQTLKDFGNLKIDNTKLMAKGIVFVWAPKDCVSEMLSIMEKKGFSYVENLQIINLDIEKAKLYTENSLHSKKIQKMQSTSTLDKTKEDKSEETDFLDVKAIIKGLQNVDPCSLIAQEPSELFNKSKRTLLMFRKSSHQKIELRHQRTCDVVFDMPLKLGQKIAPDMKSYIYNMIETLLPDCLSLVQKQKGEFELKMMELYADKGTSRRGWVSVVQD